MWARTGCEHSQEWTYSMQNVNESHDRSEAWKQLNTQDDEYKWLIRISFLKSQKLSVGDGSDSKVLTTQAWGLGSNPQHPGKSWMQGHMTVVSVLESWRWEGLWGLLASFSTELVQCEITAKVTLLEETKTASTSLPEVPMANKF